MEKIIKPSSPALLPHWEKGGSLFLLLLKREKGLGVEGKLSWKILLFILNASLILSLTGCFDREAPGALYGTVELVGQQDASGVIVNIEGTQLSATTDKNGSFAIMNIPIGSYTVIVSKDGFYSETKTGITISTGSVDANVSFKLTSTSPPALPEESQ